MWICHTLRNELLGAASISLGTLLKGGKRRYRGWDRTHGRAGLVAPGQGTRCCCVPRPGVPEAIPASAGAPWLLGSTNPSAIAAVCGCQSVARDSGSHIKAAIQGRGGAGLERAASVSSKQSL